MQKIIGAFTILFAALFAHAATYTVAASGGDYATIQACASVVNPGDVCLVYEGNYPERTTASRGGTGPTNLVTFKAQGTVTTQGFSVTGNYIRIEGFVFNSINSSSSYIVNAAASYAEIVNNTFQGPYDAFLGAVGISSNNSESSKVTGNVFDGLNMGTAIAFYGTGHLAENNIIRNSSDIDAFRVFGRDHIIRRNSMIDITDGPIGNHIDFIQTFGQNGRNCHDLLIEQNFVMNVDGQIGQLTQGCGLDPSGSNAKGSTCSLMTEANGQLTSLTATSLTDSTKSWIVGIWVENYWAGRIVTLINGNATGKSYLITANTNDTLTLSNLDGSAANLVSDGVDVGDSYEMRMRVGWWTFRNNIFVNVIQLSNNLPGMTFTNNTFVNVPSIATGDSENRGRSFDTTIVGNIHMFDKNNTILYKPQELLKPSFRADYNYASMGPPDYIAKLSSCSEEYTDFRFCEAVWPGKHGINGGDPLLINIANPLGADGVPFTLDDGLKPTASSLLCGADENGADIGAYSCDPNVVFVGGDPEEPPTPAAPTITTSCPLPSGQAGAVYSQTMTATGTTPITWDLSAGALPTGLTLASGGALTGTPTQDGTFNFTLRATNSVGNDTEACSVVIAAADPPTGRKFKPSGRVRFTGPVRTP